MNHAVIKVIGMQINNWFIIISKFIIIKRSEEFFAQNTMACISPFVCASDLFDYLFR